MLRLRKLSDANEAATRVAKACVDFGKIAQEVHQAQLAAVTEYLAKIPETMMRRLTTLDEGILLKSKFMPTVADYEALRRELEAKEREYQPSHTSYRRLTAADKIEPDTPEDVQRRKDFIAGLDLHKQFPEGGHRRDKPDRVQWDDSLGPPTEQKLNPHRIKAGAES